MAFNGRVLKNKFVKKHGRLLMVALVAIVAGASVFAYHYESQVKAKHNAQIAKQAADAAISAKEAATAAKAKVIFDWQIHYGSLYSAKFKQDTDNIINPITALGSNATFEAERAAGQPECIN